jgi:O-antigen/teichoic acid export membrane protein
MEFGKYLGKGIWGLADKALPVLYGVAYVVLVIRVLPEEEFGNFVLVQEIFLIVTGLAAGFALNPLLKFAAEEESDQRSVVSAGLLLYFLFTAAAAVLTVVLRTPLARLFNSPALAPLLLYLPAMLAASFLRNFAMVLLQARFLIREIFWTDAAHFLGVSFLIWVLSRMHLFDTAEDLLQMNLISLTVSSLVGMWYARHMVAVTTRIDPATVRKLWEYGRYSLGGIVSQLFYTRADSFILAAFTGPVQVAVYNSVKVFTRVYEMVTQVVQMFVFPAVSRLSSKGDEVSLKVLVEKAIAFSTIGMLPVLVGFVVLAPPLVHTVYGSRYAEAIPLLQAFAFLSLIVPLTAVALNTLLGLGHARRSFWVSAQCLFASIVIYVITIPLYGVAGAAIGYILSSAVLAWLAAASMRRYVEVTGWEVWQRKRDIVAFLRNRFRQMRG